jgi:DNA end-binding protein Ku
MQRPIWSGSISFGLVNVPIRLYNAVKRKTVSFHQLRQSDGCRIRLKKVCSTDGSEVANENIVKGYEISPDRYVTVSNEDLQALYPKISKSIEIEDFVDLTQIDPIYLEQSYYVVPDKGAAKAYTLLLAAMKDSGKVAIARFVLRNKEYLATLRPADRLLCLSTMFFADEIISVDQISDLPETELEPNKRELTMAKQLIESLSADFDPQKYHNDYHARVMNMIEQKAEGQEIVVRPAAEEGAKVIDLMAALEASLAAVKTNPPVKAKAKVRRKKAHA